MIELLLQAERALAVGLVDQAERMYRQAAAADPRNSIAVVGLARVALERADDAEAYRRAKEALTIDPENVAAARLAGRLEEVFAQRAEALPGMALPAVEVASVRAVEASARAVESWTPPVDASAPALDKTPAPSPEVAPAPSSAPPARRSLVDRLLRRNRP
jgi:tetratricopeptide (TPR) repeat protein